MMTEEDLKEFTYGFFSSAALGPAVLPEELERLATTFAALTFKPIVAARENVRPEDQK